MTRRHHKPVNEQEVQPAAPVQPQTSQIQTNMGIIVGIQNTISMLMKNWLTRIAVSIFILFFAIAILNMKSCSALGINMSFDNTSVAKSVVHVDSLSSVDGATEDTVVTIPVIAPSIIDTLYNMPLIDSMSNVDTLIEGNN